MSPEPLTPPLRVALVGLGYWGIRLAEAAEVTPEIQITHCFSRSEATRLAFASRFGYRPAASYEEILENPEIEGVLLITPNRVHHQQMLQAIAHRKHLFVDKPITTTLEEGAEVVAAAEAAGLILALDHQARCEAPIRRMKALLDQGVLGRTHMAEGNHTTANGFRVRPGDWRESRAECPGGPLIQIGIHFVDNLQYLLGPIVRVHGWQRRRAIAAPIDDTTVTLLEFADGTLGYLGSGYACSPAAWIKIYGEAATGLYDRSTGLTVSGAPVTGNGEMWATPPTIDSDPSPMICELLANFARSVRLGYPPEVDGRTALSNLAVVLAAVRSNETGRPVDVTGMLRAAGTYWV